MDRMTKEDHIRCKLADNDLHLLNSEDRQYLLNCMDKEKEFAINQLKEVLEDAQKLKLLYSPDLAVFEIITIINRRIEHLENN